jgi:hypothetical protein
MFHLCLLLLAHLCFFGVKFGRVGCVEVHLELSENSCRARYLEVLREINGHATKVKNKEMTVKEFEDTVYTTMAIETCEFGRFLGGWKSHFPPRLLQ